MAKRLTEHQIAAITLLSLPKRGGFTYEEIAEKVGVSRQALYEWRKDDGFNSELKNEIVRNTIDDLPEVMASISGHIIESGNAAMLRTLLQAHGMLTDKVEVASVGSDGSVDAIKAEIERMRKG